MNLLLVSSVLFGLFVIVVRAPFAYGPAETMQFYRRTLFASPARSRACGALLGAIGVLMLVSGQGVERTMADIIQLLGGFLAFVGGLFIISPGPFGGFGLQLMDGFGASFLRGAGVAGVVFGVVWIYFSFVLL